MRFRVVPGLTAKLGTWIERARVQRERPLWAEESWEGLRDEPGWAGQGLERRGLPGGEDALASPPLLPPPAHPALLSFPPTHQSHAHRLLPPTFTTTCTSSPSSLIPPTIYSSAPVLQAPSRLSPLQLAISLPTS